EMPRLLASKGATKISAVYPDLAGAAAAVPVMAISAAQAKAELVNKVAVPIDATDLSPYIAAAEQGGANGIAAVLIGDQGGKLYVGLKQQNFTGKTATISVFLTPQLIQSVGSALNGVLV